jgi:glycolate oxidase FAD binding subunit
MTKLSPTSESETVEAVLAARTAQRPFIVEGGGTRAGLGRPPVETQDVLSTRNLTGVTLYEPAELVISARAGTPLAEIETMLGANNQRLVFEPMDHRQLLGSQGEPSIGGIAACNISGPRRINSGAARDHLIGIRLVNGCGEVIKSGGRVMKNVTGLDLVKLCCGAHGTLGVLTEVTFKVLPKPECTGTLAVVGLDDGNAIAALCTAVGSPFEILGAAHLPAGCADTQALTLLRLEGVEASVAYRLEALRKTLNVYGAGEIIAPERAAKLWCDIRDAEPLAEPRDTAIWRISTAPALGAQFVEAIRRSLDLRYFYDWAGGLIWLAVAAKDDAGASQIREVVARIGGHATLVRGPAELRASVPVFEPLAAPLMKITEGLKASFDPDRIINPGRMYAGV